MIRTLKHRRQFKLISAVGCNVIGRYILMQYMSSDCTLFGLTVTKKIGGAVVRNRIKRRLRYVISLCVSEFVLNAHYVVIARKKILGCSSYELESDLRYCISELECNMRHSDVNVMRNE